MCPLFVLPAARLLFLLFCVSVARFSHGQAFMHPGIAQSGADLAYMKQLVLKGQEPYK